MNFDSRLDHSYEEFLRSQFNRREEKTEAPISDRNYGVHEVKIEASNNGAATDYQASNKNDEAPKLPRQGDYVTSCLEDRPRVWARREHVFNLRCEGLTFAQIGGRIGVSAGVASAMCAKFSKRLQRAMEPGSFRGKTRIYFAPLPMSQWSVEMLREHEEHLCDREC